MTLKNIFALLPQLFTVYKEPRSPRVALRWRPSHVSTLKGSRTRGAHLLVERAID